MNIIVGVIAIVIGIGFVVAGRGNVSRRLSSDTGARRLAARAAGGTSEHAGGVAAVTRLGARRRRRRAHRLRRRVHGPRLSLVRRGATVGRAERRV